MLITPEILFNFTTGPIYPSTRPQCNKCGTEIRDREEGWCRTCRALVDGRASSLDRFTLADLGLPEGNDFRIRQKAEYIPFGWMSSYD